MKNLATLGMAFILAACAAPATPAATTEPAPAAAVTRTPEPTATDGLVVAPPLPAAPTAPPTASPTLASIPTLTCRTPRSLMLHSAFGGERAQALAGAILARGYQTLTYRDLLAGLERGECPPPNAIIVSLDDLNTSWNRREFYEIVGGFEDQGLVMVLGVVAQNAEDETLWDVYRRWAAAGFEIASHSASHYQFSALTDESLANEIQGSYAVICDGLGECPVTLILPFGDGLGDARVLSLGAGYVFHIGIAGGRSFGGIPPFLLGRIPPDNADQELTLNLLDGSFAPGGN